MLSVACTEEKKEGVRSDREREKAERESERKMKNERLDR